MACQIQMSKQNIVAIFINFNNISLIISMQLPQPFSHNQPQSSNFIRDSSTQSDNSSESGTKKSLKQTTPLTKKQIEEFNLKIKQEIAFNKKRYQKLSTLNPYFSIKLYSPVNSFMQDDYHSGTLKKMMKQIDMLLDQGNLLEKQIKKSQLRHMQSDYLDPHQRDEIKSHYTYLRKMWTDISKLQQKNIPDRLQELNKRVVMIKNNIFSVTQHQKKCYSHLQKYQNVDKMVKSSVYNTEEYRLMKEKCEHANMENEQILNRLKQTCQQYQKKLSEKNEEINKLIKDSEEQKKINNQLKQRMLSNQRKLQQRISQLESQIKLKAKLSSNMKQNHQHQNNIKFLKQQNYVHQIKFRKIDYESNRKNSFEITTDRAIVDEMESIKGKQLQKDCVVKAIKTIEQNQPEQVEEQYAQENIERTELRDNKSIDGRRGRFARMRSPANGKLIKPKGEYLSPRIKDSKVLAGVSACQ